MKTLSLIFVCMMVSTVSQARIFQCDPKVADHPAYILGADDSAATGQGMIAEIYPAGSGNIKLITSDAKFELLDASEATWMSPAPQEPDWTLPEYKDQCYVKAGISYIFSLSDTAKSNFVKATQFDGSLIATTRILYNPNHKNIPNCQVYSLGRPFPSLLSCHAL